MIYLDNAATTFPKPANVIEEVTSILNNGVGTPGRGTHSSAVKANAVFMNIRKTVAKFFNMLDDYRVIFTYSATDALNMAIKGFIDDNDHILISNMEHNSVLRPLRGLEKLGKITLDIIATDDNGYIDLDDLSEKLKVKTKLVIISHATNVTGVVQPIDKIATMVRNSGAYFMLDGAQSVGVIPINMQEVMIDFLAFSGHKGLYGIQGTGVLILGDRVTHLRSFREGGTGFDSKSEVQPLNWPEAFEAGTPNVLGIISLGAGLQFINETGIKNIALREDNFLKQIWNDLSSYKNIHIYGPPPSANRVALLSFTIDGWSADDVGSIFNQNYDIHLRTGLHCSPLAHKRLGTLSEGTVRVSPGYFNNDADIKNFLKVIRTIATTEVCAY